MVDDNHIEQGLGDHIEWIDLKDVSREARDEFHHLADASTKVSAKEFAQLLDQADPLMFQLQNANGLNLFSHVINQIYHGDEMRFARKPDQGR